MPQEAQVTVIAARWGFQGLRPRMTTTKKNYAAVQAQPGRRASDHDGLQAAGMAPPVGWVDSVTPPSAETSSLPLGVHPKRRAAIRARAMVAA